MTGLARAVRTVVRNCLAVRPGEDVLVVVDEPLQDVGEALRREAAGRAAPTPCWPSCPRARTTATSRRRRSPPRSPRATSSSRPPSRSLSHTRARKARHRQRRPRRDACPGVTADMLARLMAADFDAPARAQPRGGRAAERRRRGARHLPARHRPAPRPARPRGHRRRRRPHRARRVRQPAVRRGLHRAAPAARGRSPRARWPRSASSRATRRT